MTPAPLMAEGFAMIASFPEGSSGNSN